MTFRAVAIRFVFMAIALAVVFAGCKREPKKIPETQPSEAKVVVATTRPAGALPKETSCVSASCHAVMASANHIHGPVAQIACDSCHAADTGGHIFPLKRQGNATCTFCHSVTGQHSVQHAAIQKDGCIGCHDPHASRSKFLIKADSVQLLCAKCHEVPLKKFAHEPFFSGQCTLCHQAHEADSAKLLRGGNGKDHCFMCHTDMKDAMAKASSIHEPAAQDCIKCHSPHTSDYPAELKAVTAELCLSCHKQAAREIEVATVKHSCVTEGKSCANCHDPHAASGRILFNNRMDLVCANCHEKEITTKTGKTIKAVAPSVLGKNLHGPIRNGDCSACHQAHGSANGGLLRKTFPISFYAPFAIDDYALCFSCHEKEMVLQPQTTSLTNFRDGSRNLHFVHVNREEKGRSCKSCHEMHGSDLPKHMASAVPFEGSNWAMPMRYEANSDGGACSPGCHASQTYKRSATTRPTGGVQ